MAAGFGVLLREYRVRAGWTQEELAERSGISPHAISVLESGRRRPRLSSVAWLATALGLDATAREQLIEAATAERPSAPVRSVQDRAGSTAAAGVTLCQLPSDTRLFTGRKEELDRLLALTEAAPGGSDAGMVVISAIDGMGGVGKSALAVHAAHRMRASFPDGQLFIDLHGHTAGLAPVSAEDALERLLLSLGVPPQSVPQDLGARAGFFRARLADTRTLIVLDNAVSTAQVRPLLPGTPGCLVLVTSRRRLTGLDDAHSLALDTLGPGEAAALLHKVAGAGRIPADHPATGELVALCGHLPLALRIAAARLRHRRALRIEDLVEELRDERDRLDRLSDEDRDLAAVFETSFTALPEPEQQLFSRLALVPGPDFDAYAAANLTGSDLRTAERLLESLLDHHLVMEHTPGRYRFHDLVGLYARARGGSAGDDREREAALARLLDFYQHSAAGTDQYVGQYSRPTPAPTTPVPAVAPRLSDRAQALAWLRAEHGNLLAAATGMSPTRVIALSASVAPFLLQDGPWRQAADLHRAAAAAARETGDRHGEAGALGDLGRVRHALAEFKDAGELHEQALAVYQELGDRHGEACALEDVARIRYMLGEFRTAHGLHERALAIYQELGDRHGEAHALWGLGRARNATGEYETAADALERAVAAFTSVGKRLGEANARWDLSRVRRATGDHAGSVDLLEEALTIMQELGNRHGVANVLWSLGQLRAVVGDHTAAADAFEQALAIYVDLGKPDGEAYCLKDLGRLHLATGDVAGATDLLERALTVFRAHDLRYGELNMLHDLGRARQASGETTAAAALFEQSRAFQREYGDQAGEAEVVLSAASLAVDTHGPQAGRALYQEARQLAREGNSRLIEAKALEGVARCAELAGDRDAATAELRQAVDLYRGLGVAEAEPAAARLAVLESGDLHG
ncbi:tetratricopeptide (TPR) repeat protein/transcriptional regulator with XRE-family HTH domain [Kitasatospora gansuensis]|uniref:Tetratricopeptide (TPR) repeat protein/transcriptional regulator with XRE-family HTH domain n=1 Tax=Kitasatospora gansuensis TaxID=258050 RepID=A0A7W7SJY1_9ACTN|nr:helix-turn-helix domain-containing protein [Kitasatospora gansuensis]MBB4950696.1 tetratricopeptide (TPR) repeat protein/transcriptional regulator with XRE-family HTH domain [Kitasatospora gansuensis]